MSEFVKKVVDYGEQVYDKVGIVKAAVNTVKEAGNFIVEGVNLPLDIISGTENAIYDRS